MVDGARFTRPDPWALVSLDGLGLDDLDEFLARMPRSARRLAGGRASRLDAEPLTGAAAIWGELLTGSPWYLNGCSGHAAPWKTLNHVRVLTERDLAVPLKLLGEDSRQLVVNVPLLLPDPSSRLWLADGSLPLATTVSPPSLLADEPFRSYRPRPYSALIQAVGNHERAVLDGIEIERRRLDCARALIEAQAPDVSIIRLSVLDQLCHVLGPRWFADESLRWAREIRGFLGFLDGWLDDLFGRVARVAVISAFSHVPCRSKVSLNSMLEGGGYLSLAPPDVMTERRVAAIAAVTASRAAGDPGIAPVRYSHPRFRQPVLDPARTVAASPVVGGIFVNACDSFDDGIVDPPAVDATRRELRSFLADTLGRVQRTGVSIWTGEEIGAMGRPDLLVSVEGAEMHNSYDPLFGPLDRPRSVHGPGGFLWTGRPGTPPVVTSTELWSSLD
jgi:hypothetical protein